MNMICRVSIISSDVVIDRHNKTDLLDGTLTINTDSGKSLANNFSLTMGSTTIMLNEGFQFSLLSSQQALQLSSTNSFHDSMLLFFNDTLLYRKLEHILKEVTPSLLSVGRNRPRYDSIDENRFYSISNVDNGFQLFNNIPANIRKDIHIFETFAKQELAFQYYDSLPPQHQIYCKLFTYETITLGKRHFLVADIFTFTASHQYFALPLCDRHVYEIIREDCPCRLYFDVEYNKVANPTVSQQQGDEMTRQWIHLILWKLDAIYGIGCNPEMIWNNIIVLDSSTNEKYSKHIIFRQMIHEQVSYGCHQQSTAAEWLFPNNQLIQLFLSSVLWDMTVEEQYHHSGHHGKGEVKMYVNGQLRYVRQEYLHFWLNNKSAQPSPPLIPHRQVPHSDNGHPIFDVMNDNNYQAADNDGDALEQRQHLLLSNNKSFFVDMGVYTRNRAFRLYGSCKHGKKKAFGLTTEDAKVYNDGTIDSSSNVGIGKSKTSMKESDLIKAKRLKILLDSFVVPFDLYEYDRHHVEMVGKKIYSRKYMMLQSTAAGVFDRTKFRGRYQMHMNVHSNYQSQQQYSTAMITSSSSSKYWKDRMIDQSKQSRQASWFPLLDDFIGSTYAHRDQTEGYIHSWTIYMHPNGDFPIYKIRYDIHRNRYCECIGRQHKSNGIFIDVDLMNQEAKQGCWDNECKSFAFKSKKLPSHFLPNAETINEMVESKK